MGCRIPNPLSDYAIRIKIRKPSRILPNRCSPKRNNVFHFTSVYISSGDTVKFSHAVGLTVLTLFLIVVGGATNTVPYSFSIPVFGGLTLVALVFWLDPEQIPFTKNGVSFVGKSSSRDLVVEPNDALNWLNKEKIPEIPAYRKLNLDKTSEQNKKIYTRRQKVNENGEEKVKFGVIGRPKNMFDKEMIAYVVHCDTGDIEYSGNLHTADERTDPFNGKHQWIRNAGYKAKVEEETNKRKSTGVNIYQGPANNGKGENLDE